MDCRAVIRVLWDYIDGELPRSEVEAVRHHLAMCKRCYPQYAFEIAFLERVAGLKEAAPPPPAAIHDHVRMLARETPNA